MTAPVGLCVDTVTGQVSDPVATPVLTAVMQAVVDLYEAHPVLEPPCSWGLVSGSQMDVARGGYAGTAADGSTCAGLLTVRLVSVVPTGQPDPSYVRQFHLSWRVDVEVGMWRPAAQPEETGDGLVLPALDVVQAEADTAALDAAVVRAALLGWAQDQDVPVQLGPYLPWGPDGGIVGGVTTCTYEIV